MTHTPAVAAGFAIVALTAVMACGSSSPPTAPAPPPPPEPTGVTLPATSLTLNGSGATGTLTATVTPTGVPGMPTWSSDRPGVATVSGSGRSASVAAVSAGTAYITATLGSHTASATVVVVPKVRTLTIDPGSATLDIGSTTQLSSILDTEAGAPTGVSWTSGAASVATVSQNGVVTATGSGSATITATSTADPSVMGTAAITVRSAPAPTVQWSQTTAFSWQQVDGAGVIRSIGTGADGAGVAVFDEPSGSGSGLLVRVNGSWQKATGLPFTNPVATGSIGSDIWVATETGTFARSNGATFTMMTGTPVSPGAGWPPYITAVKGISPGVAVAWQAESNRLILLNGNSWTTMPSPPVTHITGATGSSASDIVVSGTGGSRVVRWNGEAWTSLPNPPGSIVSEILRLSNGDLLVATAPLTTARFNGSSWSIQSAPPRPQPHLTPSGGTGIGPGYTLQSLTECGGAVYAGTYQDGRVLRLSGTAWETVGAPQMAAPGSWRSILSCWSDGSLRASGGLTISRWSGAEWRLELMNEDANTVKVLRSDLAWANFSGGILLTRWNGSTWSEPAVANSAFYSGDLTAASDGTAMVTDNSHPVGTYFVDGPNVTRVPSLDASNLWLHSRNFGLSPSSRWNGSSWAAVSVPPGQFIGMAIDGTSAELAFVFGITGWSGNQTIIRRWNGTQWTGDQTFTGAGYGDTGYYYLDVMSPTFAVAINSTFMFRWDGTSWSTLPLPGDLRAGGQPVGIAAISPGEIYTATRNGSVWRWNGSAWSRIATIPDVNGDPGDVIRSISAVPGLAVIIGSGGRIFHATTPGSGTAIMR